MLEGTILFLYYEIFQFLTDPLSLVLIKLTFVCSGNPIELIPGGQLYFGPTYSLNALSEYITFFYLPSQLMESSFIRTR